MFNPETFRTLYTLRSQMLNAMTEQQRQRRQQQEAKRKRMAKNAAERRRYRDARTIA